MYAILLSRTNNVASRIAAGAALVYLLVAAFLAPLPAQAATAAENFVQENVDKGYAILRDNGLDEDQRAAKVRAFLQSIVDTKRVALFTLGPYAREADAAQIEAFQNAFAGFVTEVLLRDIADNPKEAIMVTGSQARAPDDVIVTAKLTGSMHSAQPLNVAFRVRKNAAGADTLVDLQFEGIWLAVSERDDFSAWLQQHRGDIAGLTRELQERTDRMRHGDETAGHIARQ